ncbi:MAG: LTA synthase family protein [Spirochaetales bacterium]|nr:LTA synthase family protein [Leptospiraceae bacterium]MCP5481241.1 LTA synthase family protein [Spirochaetales bacterium]MCP5485677.1 LTA synthase family protein [Spirochaetales bacterium]
MRLLPRIRALFNRPFVGRLLGWGLAALGILLIHRLGFLIANYEGAHVEHWVQVLVQSLRGLQFDMATIPLLLLPFVLLLPIYLLQPGRRLRLALAVGEGLQVMYVGILNMVLLASTFNFAYNNKHLGWEFWAYLNDFWKLMAGVWEQSMLLAVAYFAILPLFACLAFWIARRSYYRHTTEHRAKASRRWSAFAGALLLLIALLVFMLRGGLRESPLRPPDAMIYQSAYLNNIPLNGLYTIAYDLSDSDEFVEFYPPVANLAFVQNLLDRPTAFSVPGYPLMRYMPARQPFGLERPNIVLIVLESFTGKFLEAHGGDPNVAPNLNRFIGQGLFFERFVASGGRSANGLFCMLAGLPDRAGRTILRSNQIQNRWGGLAGLLKAKGYHTIFAHGGDLAFDNLDRVLPHLGFETSAGSEYMDRTGRYHNRLAWGYDDADLFDMAEHLASASERPFFQVIFTSNTHHPYTIPNDSFAFFDESIPEARFLNSYRYTDHVLGNFVDRMRTRPEFQNTVYVFVADHAHHTNLNYLEDRIIPFLLYAPGKITAQNVSELASQLDVLPTVLALAGGNSYYAAMGEDLTDPASRPDHAFYAGGSNTDLIGWIEGDYLLVESLSIRRSFLLTADQAAQRDLSAERPEIHAGLLAKAQNFYQFARFLERENRIWPTPAEYAVLVGRAE